MIITIPAKQIVQAEKKEQVLSEASHTKLDPQS